MAPGITDLKPSSLREAPHLNGVNEVNGIDSHRERKLGVYDDVHFDPKLRPKAYHMKGKHYGLSATGKRLTSNRYEA